MSDEQNLQHEQTEGVEDSPVIKQLRQQVKELQGQVQQYQARDRRDVFAKFGLDPEKGYGALLAKEFKGTTEDELKEFATGIGLELSEQQTVGGEGPAQQDHPANQRVQQQAVLDQVRTESTPDLSGAPKGPVDKANEALAEGKGDEFDLAAIQSVLSRP